MTSARFYKYFTTNACSSAHMANWHMANWLMRRTDYGKSAYGELAYGKTTSCPNHPYVSWFQRKNITFIDLLTIFLQNIFLKSSLKKNEI